MVFKARFFILHFLCGVLAFVMLDARNGTRAPAFCTHTRWLNLLEKSLLVVDLFNA